MRCDENLIWGPIKQMLVDSRLQISPSNLTWCGLLMLNVFLMVDESRSTDFRYNLCAALLFGARDVNESKGSKNARVQTQYDVVDHLRWTNQNALTKRFLTSQPKPNNIVNLHCRVNKQFLQTINQTHSLFILALYLSRNIHYQTLYNYGTM